MSPMLSSHCTGSCQRQPLQQVPFFIALVTTLETLGSISPQEHQRVPIGRLEVAALARASMLTRHLKAREASGQSWHFSHKQGPTGLPPRPTSELKTS